MRTLGVARWNGKACVYQLLDPSDADVDLWNEDKCGGVAKHQLLEMIIASVFANGLSRYGSRYAFEPPSMNNSRHNPFRWVLRTLLMANNYYASLLKNNAHHDAVFPAPANSEHVKVGMRMHVVGYAWYASGFSEYFAIAVVIAYMLVVLAHT